MFGFIKKDKNKPVENT